MDDGVTYGAGMDSTRERLLSIVRCLDEVDRKLREGESIDWARITLRVASRGLADCIKGLPQDEAVAGREGAANG